MIDEPERFKFDPIHQMPRLNTLEGILRKTIHFYTLFGMIAESITIWTSSVQMSGSERNKQALNKFLSPLEILPYDEHAIWHYAKLHQE